MRKLYLFSFFFIFTTASLAQTSGHSGTGANIDVDNYQIWWRLNPDSSVIRGIKGVVKIKFRTTVANVTSVSFDLNSTFTTTQTLWRTSTVTPTRSGHIITLPVNIPVAGTRDSVTISYGGNCPAASGEAYGLQRGSAGGSPVQYYYSTCAESYEDRDFWPCKADMQDKADTTDISIEVPWVTGAQYTAVTNGLLVSSPINGNSRTWNYQHRYPVASYLVTVGVARFTTYNRPSITIGGKSTPVNYYLFSNGTTQAASVAAMDKASELLLPLGNLIGDYPFNDPARGGGHGFHEGLPFGGGMEHQTMSSIARGTSTSSVDLLIHELAHQWSGDGVSFSTWSDLWLAEGFACYAPALARELISGLSGSAYSQRNSIKTTALGQKAPLRIPVADIDNSDEVWQYGSGTTAYGSTVYQRGAMVIQTLRTLCGDAKFFASMKGFNTRPGLQYKSANSDSLRNVFIDTLGKGLTVPEKANITNVFTNLFADYVSGNGYPVYNIGWQKFGPGQKSLALSVVSQARQRGSDNVPASTVSYFNGPVVVRVSNGVTDTLIVFYDHGSGNLSKAGNGIQMPIPGNALTYNLSFSPTSVTFDDQAMTLSTGSTSTQVIVDLKVLEFSARAHGKYNDALLVLDDNTNNSDIILERAADGVNFTELGSMTLQASAAANKRYIFNDLAPLDGDNYYRGKFRNSQGVMIYTKTVKLGATEIGDFVILNNPVHDKLQVRTANALGKNLSFTVYDASSKIVTKAQVQNAGMTSDIALPALAAGVYILNIREGAGINQNIRFVVR